MLRSFLHDKAYYDLNCANNELDCKQDVKHLLSKAISNGHLFAICFKQMLHDRQYFDQADNVEERITQLTAASSAIANNPVLRTKFSAMNAEIQFQLGNLTSSCEERALEHFSAALHFDKDHTEAIYQKAVILSKTYNALHKDYNKLKECWQLLYKIARAHTRACKLAYAILRTFGDHQLPPGATLGEYLNIKNGVRNILRKNLD